MSLVSKLGSFYRDCDNCHSPDAAAFEYLDLCTDCATRIDGNDIDVADRVEQAFWAHPTRWRTYV